MSPLLTNPFQIPKEEAINRSSWTINGMALIITTFVVEAKDVNIIGIYGFAFVSAMIENTATNNNDAIGDKYKR